MRSPKISDEDARALLASMRDRRAHTSFELGGNRMTRIAVIYRFLQMSMRVW
jgi:hypothetical protein